jgi:hypothetical protein
MGPYSEVLVPSRIPGKAIAAVIGTVILLLLAFRLPAGSQSAAGDTGVDSADGAAVVDPNVPGVTTPPEGQPGVDIPQPAAGQQPTQLVVVSVDGGCETANGTIAKFLDTGRQSNARFTFFLSGLCLLPDAARMQYHPPGKEPGQSDVPFADPNMVAQRVKIFTDMYRAGHEIGTHFLGHFCSPGGVDDWSADQWGEEIAQARQFLDTWPRNNPQAAGSGVLPFDSSVFKGDRTPCLLGQRPAMWTAFKEAGFRYDASDPGQLKWPTKVADGALWEFPLPALKLAGTNLWVLSMDYNLLVNQTNGETTGDPDSCKRVEDQTYQTYMDALAAVHEGNRAPLILGSHLNDWQCNGYINALERFVADVPAKYPDVKMVSFADLADWLDKMDPAELQKLQALPEQRY